MRVEQILGNGANTGSSFVGLLFIYSQWWLGTGLALFHAAFLCKSNIHFSEHHAGLGTSVVISVRW